MTKLPPRGTVLVRAAGVPDVPTDQCVDVRPGPFATFEGGRLRTSLWVRGANERRRFERDELPDLEDAVVAYLRANGAGDEREAAAASGRAGAVARFGDRAAYRRLHPVAAVETVERRLAVAARRGAATLLSWTTAPPRTADRRDYDVVLDGPPTRSE